MTTLTPEVETPNETQPFPDEENMSWSEFKRVMEEASLSSRPRFDDEWYERNGLPQPDYMTEETA